MKYFSGNIATLILAVCLLLPLEAYARCGGLCLYEIGIPDQGASGAGQSARANDASTVYTNPAGMTRLAGHQAMFSLSGLYFDPEMDLNLDNTTTALPGETNQGGGFGGFVPLGGAFVSASITEDLKAGLSLGGTVGGSVDFDSNWIGRQYITQSDLAILEITPTVAYRIDEIFSIGAGVRVGYALLDWDLKAFPGPNSPTVKLEDGDDWAVSALVGLMAEISENTRIGLVYNGPIEFDLGGDVRNPSDQRVRFDAEVPLPQGINLALYQKLNDSLALLADAGWTDWSEFDFQGLQVTGPRGGTADGAIPRNFKDTYRIGLGLEHQEPGSPLLVRGGVGFDSSSVPDSARLPDTTVDWTWRFSGGAQYQVSETVVVGGSYTLIYAGDQEYDQVPLKPDNSVILDGETDDTIGHAFAINVNWIFGGDSGDVS